jgi:hypothetical protein
MITQKEIEENTLERFSFLKNIGFKKSVIKHTNYKTDVIFLDEDLGIQIELDWYDCYVGVLLVDLNKGKLPGGYYMFNGKKVRVHFLSFVEKLRGPEMQIEIPKIYSKKTSHGGTEACLKLMNSQTEQLAKLLEETIKRLPNNQFDKNLVFE